MIRLFLFIFGELLFADGAYLIALKKTHLGIILPFFIGLTFIILAISWQPVQYYLKQHHNLQKLWHISWILLGIWIISLIGFFYILQYNQTSFKPNSPIKAILVLGSGTENGQPSPILASRLDTAEKIAVQYPDAKIVLSGGMDFKASISEANVMATYLQKNYHISSSKMILEDQSTSTELNLKNSTSLMAQHHIDKTDSIAIVTSDFHTLRAKAIAEKQHFTNITMVGAPTPLLTRYNAWLREYFAFISGKILQEY